MKNLIYICIASLLLTACSTYRTLNLGRLTTGMTKAQVESVAGRPYRVLAVNDTHDGYQEVLEYRTSAGEIYALEFWNDYLTGYEYIDEEYNYIPVAVPPAYYPDYGRPIVVIPGRPNRPRPPVSNRPPSNPRPPSNSGNRPPTSTRPPSRPTTRPTENSRPVGERPNQNVESTRQSNDRTGSQRSSGGSVSSGRTSSDRTR